MPISPGMSFIAKKKKKSFCYTHTHFPSPGSHVLHLAVTFYSLSIWNGS